MQRSRFAVMLALMIAFVTAGPVLAQESTPGAEETDRPALSLEEEASPAAEDEPQVDLLNSEPGAWPRVITSSQGKI